MNLCLEVRILVWCFINLGRCLRFVCIFVVEKVMAKVDCCWEFSLVFDFPPFVVVFVSEKWLLNFI